MPGKVRSRNRGSILVFFLLAVPIFMIPLVGLAVDATMLRIVQARLSASVDGAVLGAGRLLGTSADPQNMAKEFIKANFQATGAIGFWGATNLQVSTSYTPGITKTIWVNATTDVPLLFSRVFGRSSMTVSAAGTSTRTDSRIVLVIDRSGSMHNTGGDGNLAITDAVNQAVAFTKSFTAGSDEVGLVVFDGSGYVGYPVYSPGTFTITPGNSGGPDTSFSTTMVNLLNTPVASNNGATNTSEALWLAYVELQKAHLRDTAGGGADTRLNSIVMLTDGIPQGVTIYPNNVSNYAAVDCSPAWSSTCLYDLKTTALTNAGTVTSSCNNRRTAANQNPTAMYGFVQVAANWGGSGASVFNGQNPQGMYLLDSLDSTSTDSSSWYMGSGAGKTTALTSTLTAGCTGLQTMGTNTGNDLIQIPSIDAYGNTMSGSAYKNSSFLDTTGNVVAAANNPIYQGSGNIDMTATTSGPDWIKASWNAADSAATRIRTDVNLANRHGDVKMPIYIYTIGYLHIDGLDQGLLARIANDKNALDAINQSSAYDPNSPPGQFILASNTDEMSQAFDTIRATMLRLSR
jgi:hypothetical protein